MHEKINIYFLKVLLSREKIRVLTSPIGVGVCTQHLINKQNKMNNERVLYLCQ